MEHDIVKLKGRFSGVEVILDGKEIICDDDVLEQIKEHAEHIKQNGIGLIIDDWYFPASHFFESMSMNFILVNDIEPMDIVEGKSPLYDLLGKMNGSVLTNDGGPGSGNWNHSGVIGQLGGSAPKGSGGGSVGAKKPIKGRNGKDYFPGVERDPEKERERRDALQYDVYMKSGKARIRPPHSLDNHGDTYGENKCHGFADEQKSNEHFKDHGLQLQIDNEDDYVLNAKWFCSQPIGGDIIGGRDLGGAIVRIDKKEMVLGIMNPKTGDVITFMPIKYERSDDAKVNYVKKNYPDIWED